MSSQQKCWTESVGGSHSLVTVRGGKLRDQLPLWCGVLQPLAASCVFYHLTLNDYKLTSLLIYFHRCLKIVETRLDTNTIA